ncbi:Peptide deformylase [hydrothermal vent metagenome]|uniref:Peptide deformylase n=1 Tax=hydrothermal vent metagenome TaxID=652676 RepID=A0A1W1BIP8_9ZZZZ
MAKLNILKFPNKKLRTIAKKVERVDEGIKKLVNDMFETMYEEQGIGLAATQVDNHQQVVVMNVDENKQQPLCFINPKIIQKSGEIVNEEGCLSVPEFRAKITRAENITVEALDVEGNFFELQADGLLAVCIQHELDHLKGKLFVDYLSKIKQQRLKKRLEKFDFN